MDLKKALLNILVILAVAAIVFWGTRRYYPKTVDNTIVDTVRVETTQTITEVKEVEKPVRVTEYKTRVDTVTEVRLERDTVFVEVPPDTIRYPAGFLTNFPTAPKLLGGRYTGSRFTLDYFTVSGESRSKTWSAPNGFVLGLDGADPALRRTQGQWGITYGMEAGWNQYWRGGTPYLQLSAEYQIIAINLTGRATISRWPSVGIGVNIRKF